LNYVLENLAWSFVIRKRMANIFVDIIFNKIIVIEIFKR